MARHFVSASSQHLQAGSVPLSVTPCTIACWAKPGVALNSKVLVALSKAAANGWLMLWLFNGGGGPSGAVEAYAYDGTTSGEADTALAPLLSVWNHCAAVFTSSTSRTAYLNGVAGAINTTAVTPPTLDRTEVGALLLGGVDVDFFDGDIGEVAIWNVALTATEIGALASGAVTNTIRPASLVFYAPLAGVASPEPDLISARNLTVTGATAASTSPPIVIDAPLVVTINSVNKTGLIFLDSLTVRDVLNQPKTCTFTTFNGYQPPGGATIVITRGSVTIFGGTIVTVQQVYVGSVTNVNWVVSAINYNYLLRRRRPITSYTAVSATAVAQDLIASFTSGFTSFNVQLALPTVSINFDGSQDVVGCLAALATLIGGYAHVDDARDLHFFLTEATGTPDALDNANTTALNEPPLTTTQDYSQIRTRVNVKGLATALAADVVVSETILPLASVAAFDDVGSAFIQAPATVIPYTGRQTRVDGSVVGPGAAPAAAPTLAPASGTGLGTGVYQYAYTDVTAAGESLPSPIASVTTTAALSAPGALTANAPTAGIPFVDAGDHRYRVTFVTAAGETLPGTISNTITTDGSNQVVPLSSIPTGGATVTKRRIYRDFNADGNFKLVTTINNNTATTYGDGIPNASLGAAAPSSDSTAANQVALSGIAIGGTGTTSRKIYRTAVGASQLKLQQTIANNTATTGVQDATADGSLGANAPTTDTSGLTQPAGQVLAGATTLLTAGTGAFVSSGGWVRVGGQSVRYTGLSGNSLTGIPASGAGAIASTITYGSTVAALPTLTGCTGVPATPIGTAVRLFVQRDAVGAQATIAALTGGDGIHVGHIDDPSLQTMTQCGAAGDAALALFSVPITTAIYTTRDLKTSSGKPIVINRTHPPIGPITLTIQDVTITGFHLAAPAGPIFHVSASTVKFSLADLLTRIAEGVGIT